MTDYETIAIILGIISLLITSNLLIVSLLNFLEKKSKKK